MYELQVSAGKMSMMMMTVKQVAESLGYEEDTIRKKVKDLYPEIVSIGKTTYLTEDQVSTIKANLVPRTLALKSGVELATTDTEMRQKAAEVMAWLLRDNEALKAKNAELEPKAAFFDQVADSKTALQMRDVAAALNLPGWGRNKIFLYLRNNGILDEKNIPYREFQDRGYFRVVERTWTDAKGDTHISLTTLVYQRGIDYIRKMIDRG
jgi:phage antirepressor YoqD-like protein